MPLSLDYIRTFAAVAETGSLSGAARTLGLTQPTVGRHIDLLEADLKVALFIRGREGMVLTDRGADLVAAARSTTNAAQTFARQASGLEAEEGGTVRISVNDILGSLRLPRILARLMNDHPEIDVELDISNTAASLLRRDADIAIRMFRPTQSDLVARKVAEIPLGLYAAKSYLNAHGRPRALADLKTHRLIGLDRDPSMVEALTAMGLAITRDDFDFRSDTILAHCEAIRAGVGIGVTHEGLAARWPHVERALPALPLPPLELWLTCHSDVRYNRRVRRVMDYLGAHLKVVWPEPDAAPDIPGDTGFSSPAG